MKRLIVPALLLISLITSAQDYYGCYYAADGIGNVPVKNNQISYRFRALYTGTIDSVRVWTSVSNDEYDRAYSAGSGGTLKISLETDDGTSLHGPSGNVLAYYIETDPITRARANLGQQVTWIFTSSANLTAGTLYHLTFTNLDADPVNNYVSTDMLIGYAGNLDRMPVTPALDLAVLWQNPDWREIYTSTQYPGLFGSYTPIFTVFYSDGKKQGQGYGFAGIVNKDKINGSNYKVRENFTISGEDKIVSKVFARLRRINGTENLTIRLEQSDGTLIEAVTIPASEIGLYDPNGNGTQNGVGWVSGSFMTSHTLADGSAYHIELSTGSNTTYETWWLQEFYYYYDHIPMFTDGFYETMTNGSEWVSNKESDAQIYFETIHLISGIVIAPKNGEAPNITSNGGTLQLSTTLSPADATNKTVTWSIQNGSGKASISSDGLITAVANGSVTATATATDGSGISGNLLITITGQAVKITRIHITSDSGTTTITSNGGTLQLSTTLSPADATNKTVTWSIQNGSGKASISSDGLVTAVGNGSVTATATATDGSGISGNLLITISGQTVMITSIHITSDSGTTTINSNGGTMQLSADISPADATNKTVTWNIQNGTGKASISISGLVTAIADGSITASATANDGSGAAGSLLITIENQLVPIDSSFFDNETILEKLIHYIDPTNEQDTLQDGTIEHPYHSWNQVLWGYGYSYLQKKGTIAYESKINISSSGVILGSYGEGEQPVIQSNANDFAICAFEKNDLLIKDLHIIAGNAISCIYIIGESCDSICIENCTLENAVNGARILDGKNIILRYNTFINCSDAIYCNAKSSSIYYNIFRDNEVAINAMASLASTEIYNNVFYNNTLGISNAYTELTLYNNIFYLAKITDKAINNSQINQLISDNNIFYPEQEGFIQIGDKVYHSLSDYQYDFGLDMNSITDDPKFKDVYNHNFSLEPHSPAINAGKLLGLQQDFFGTEVPSGGLPDIGLAEFNNPSGPVTSSNNHLIDQMQDDFLVYPNPSRGIFIVYVKNNNSDGSRITIQDLSGKTVYESMYSSDLDILQEIDISHMQKGIYIVTVEDKARSLSQPIIIK